MRLTCLKLLTGNILGDFSEVAWTSDYHPYTCSPTHVVYDACGV